MHPFKINMESYFHGFKYMTPDKLITAFITTYKRPHLLGRAIQSILNQTYPHFQIIVCDNASEDETGQVVADFIKKDPRVKYHCHPQNIGMMKNYEYILSNVTTPYFSILSDDDVMLPWFYETAFKGFQEHPEIGFSSGETVILTNSGKILTAMFSFWEKEGFFPLAEGILQMMGKIPSYTFPVLTATLFHQRALTDYKIDFTNPLYWDCDFFLQIAAKHPIFISKKPCGIFVNHDDSFSGKKFDLAYRLNSYEKLISNIKNLEQIDPVIKQKLIDIFANDLINMWLYGVINEINLKKFKEAFINSKAFYRQHRKSKKALFCILISSFCYYFPFGHLMFHLLKKIARPFRKIPNHLSSLQDKYGNLFSWLQVYDIK